jgi:hypothetical protein
VSKPYYTAVHYTHFTKTDTSLPLHSLHIPLPLNSLRFTAFRYLHPTSNSLHFASLITFQPLNSILSSLFMILNIFSFLNWFYIFCFTSPLLHLNLLPHSPSQTIHIPLVRNTLPSLATLITHTYTYTTHTVFPHGYSSWPAWSWRWRHCILRNVGKHSVTALYASMLSTTAVIISYVAGGRRLAAMPQAK